jgi:hypothetical protein
MLLVDCHRRQRILQEGSNRKTEPQGALDGSNDHGGPDSETAPETGLHTGSSPAIGSLRAMPRCMYARCGLTEMWPTSSNTRPVMGTPRLQESLAHTLPEAACRSLIARTCCDRSTQACVQHSENIAQMLMLETGGQVAQVWPLGETPHRTTPRRRSWTPLPIPNCSPSTSPTSERPPPCDARVGPASASPLGRDRGPDRLVGILLRRDGNLR